MRAVRRAVVGLVIAIALASAPAVAHAMTLAESHHVTQAQARAIIRKVAKETGYHTANTDALLWIAQRESNFHCWSHSRSECHGLFQLSRGMAHGHPWWDPTWNTRRAIRYIKGRYGTPVKAKAFWCRHGWY